MLILIWIIFGGMICSIWLGTTVFLEVDEKYLKVKSKTKRGRVCKTLDGFNIINHTTIGIENLYQFSSQFDHFRVVWSRLISVQFRKLGDGSKWLPNITNRTSIRICKSELIRTSIKPIPFSFASSHLSPEFSTGAGSHHLPKSVQAPNSIFLVYLRISDPIYTMVLCIVLDTRPFNSSSGSSMQLKSVLLNGNGTSLCLERWMDEWNECLCSRKSWSSRERIWYIDYLLERRMELYSSASQFPHSHHHHCQQSSPLKSQFSTPNYISANSIWHKPNPQQTP